MLGHAIAYGGLYRHCKRVCTGSWLWKKNPLPAPGTLTCIGIAAGIFSRTLYPLSCSCSESTPEMLKMQQVVNKERNCWTISLFQSVWEVHSTSVSVIFFRSVQHQHSRLWHFQCMLGYFGVSIVHWTLTWTIGSLTCAGDLFACCSVMSWIILACVAQVSVSPSASFFLLFTC